MFIEQAPVLENREIAQNVRTIRIESKAIAEAVQPGQFLNIRPDHSYDPLLRRAYSVHRIPAPNVVELIYNVHGKGSKIFAAKGEGDLLDVMGPLGVPFHVNNPFKRAILISGGLGIAPMPILGDSLTARGIAVDNIHGARSAEMLVDDGRLVNPIFATDDGSAGVHGTVVDALAGLLDETGDTAGTRLFACGPNRMLSALADFAKNRGLQLEVSLECQMACGIGICQGCPVRMSGVDTRYDLVCRQGPNYDVNDIVLSSLPIEHG